MLAMVNAFDTGIKELNVDEGIIRLRLFLVINDAHDNYLTFHLFKFINKCLNVVSNIVFLKIGFHTDSSIIKINNIINFHCLPPRLP